MAGLVDLRIKVKGILGIFPILHLLIPLPDLTPSDPFSRIKYLFVRYQFRLDLEVTHGEEDLVVIVVLQQRGQEVLLEVERVVRLPPVLLAYQLPLEGGEAAAALLLLALDCIYVSPFTILLSI